MTVPVASKPNRSGDRADGQQIAVAKIQRITKVKILITDIPSANHCNAAIDDESLVVHTPIQPAKFAEEPQPTPDRCDWHSDCRYAPRYSVGAHGAASVSGTEIINSSRTRTPPSRPAIRS